MTNSTYDGLCYDIDAVMASLGDRSSVLHFDEAWFAYAISTPSTMASRHLLRFEVRADNAITFATQSTHKLLAALSQASMIHVQHAANRKLDMARFKKPS